MFKGSGILMLALLLAGCASTGPLEVRCDDKLVAINAEDRVTAQETQRAEHGKQGKDKAHED